MAQIRTTIADNPGGWKRVAQDKAFRDTFSLTGQSLKRPPRGFDAGHPLIEDLKRKDYVARTRFDEADAVQPDFLQRFTQIVSSGAEFVKFLSRAIGVPF
jgi:uncharacterized protein (TIGR02453 family)